MISPRRFWFPMNKENMRIPLRRQNEGCLILNCQPERLFWVRWTFSPVGLVGRSLMNISMSLWNQSGRRGGVHRVLLYISHLINTRREDLVWRLSWRPKKKKKKSTHYTSSPMEVESITFVALTRKNSKVSIQEKSCSGTGYSTEHSTGTQTFYSYEKVLT